jgi:lysophospholipid acyltransferase (LPLAT)-like uncharacterized protein
MQPANSETNPQPPAGRPVPTPPVGGKRQTGRVVPNQPKWFQRVAAAIIWALAKTLTATLRFRYHDQSGGFFEDPQAGQAIYCVWHNRLALCLQIYYGFAHRRIKTAGMAAIVSASKDGAFLAAILECFKVQPVRGSSSRRGPQALLELTSWAEQGYDLAITPDGPRGPRYRIQHGAISLAQITGLPILPASYHLSWKIQIKSWDRFQIPLPFSRCDVYMGRPIRVPREATAEQHEALRVELETLLQGLTKD